MKTEQEYEQELLSWITYFEKANVDWGKAKGEEKSGKISEEEYFEKLKEALHWAIESLGETACYNNLSLRIYALLNYIETTAARLGNSIPGM